MNISRNSATNVLFIATNAKEEKSPFGFRLSCTIIWPLIDATDDDLSYSQITAQTLLICDILSLESVSL